MSYKDQPFPHSRSFGLQELNSPLLFHYGVFREFVHTMFPEGGQVASYFLARNFQQPAHQPLPAGNICGSQVTDG